jgi:hypothetical protein
MAASFGHENEHTLNLSRNPETTITFARAAVTLTRVAVSSVYMKT